MTLSHEKELVVVTGASTGIGAAAAQHLAASGHHVLAGVRTQADAARIRSEGVEPVMLDITNTAHIEALIERIESDSEQRPLRAIINNAGISLNAPIEALPLEQWRRVFEINLFGHVAMIQAMLPFLHESKGRVVNISSVGGKMAMATYGAYAGTKFALEAMSDALRRELAPHGVQVVIVEPGAVRTEMGERGASTANDLADNMKAEHKQRYGPLMNAVVDQSLKHTRSGLPADEAGRIIANAATTTRPKTRYTVGRDAAVLTKLIRLLPDRTMDRLFASSLRRLP